ncbi:MAG: hypothetical protein ACLFRV_07640 [Acidimicrobiales bacterium]
MAGAVLNPFCSPPVSTSFKRNVAHQAATLNGMGADVWFDAMTHVLQMTGADDFATYDQWGLWDGTRGAVGSRSQRRFHLDRVFEIQDECGSPRLAPTVLLNSASGSEVVAALALTEEGLDIADGCWGTIAGTAGFWAGGADLDALVGTLAQLPVGGWFVSVVRPTDTFPVRASAEEIAGICRAIRGLSEFAPVHVSHGDLAGLPAVAAGAASIGTGWDARQRVLAMSTFEYRPPAGGGGWFARNTLERLFAFLARADVARLFAQDAVLASSVFVGALHPDGPKEAFLHHVASLRNLLDGIGDGPYEDRFTQLLSMYQQAVASWPAVSSTAQLTEGAADWVEAYVAGLNVYGQDEGWI